MRRTKQLGKLATLVAMTVASVGLAEPVDICERTEFIREEILLVLHREGILPVLHVDDCAAVDSQALADIASLSIGGGRSLRSLSAGDFDGLTGLRTLDLSGHHFETLPASVFDGLTLHHLDLSNSRLASLSAGVFDGLSLSTLDLSHNDLTMLPADVFDGMTFGPHSELDLDRNRLTSLPEGLFDGLDQQSDSQGLKTIAISLRRNYMQSLPPNLFDDLTLSSLDLSGNKLTTIDAATFDGLTFLVHRNAQTILHLNQNPLKTIESGAFDGLTVGALVLRQNRTPMTIKAGAFDGLTVGGLTLSDSSLETIESMAFDGLTFVSDRTLKPPPDFWYIVGNFDLSENRLRTLPAGVFRSLTDLISLDLSNNELTALSSGVFDGLQNLVSLNLGNNELSSLPLGLFNGLRLGGALVLSGNDLMSLPAGIFRDIFQTDHDAYDTSLHLNGNSLTAIEADTFNGTTVETLDLFDNPLTTLAPGAFRGLVGKLRLWNTLLTTISSGTFEGFGRSETRPGFSHSGLELRQSPVSTIQPGAFRGAVVGRIEVADLPLLTNLRSGTFDGLTLRGPLNILNVGLTDIDRGAFRGVTIENRSFALALYGTKLTTIGAGAFDGLAGTLYGLALQNNRLSGIAAGTFDDLFSSEARYLALDDNHLVGLTTEAPLFANLPDGVDVRLGQQTQAPIRAGGICDRSDAVIKAITSLEHCAAVGLEELEAVTSLDVAGPVKAGDFEGLPNLKRLSLTARWALPEGVFNGLNALNDLHLVAHLDTLPDGVFDRLTALTELHLAVYVLRTLPARAFDNLAALEELSLRGDRLATLPEGVFTELTALKSLELVTGLTTLPAGLFPRAPGLALRMRGSSRLTTVQAGAFDGAGLASLDLSLTRLTTLPVGAFRGLPSLKRLDLSDNRLKTLSAHTFEGLVGLTDLRLYESDITALPKGLFSGLNLDKLDLRRNPLTAIEAGAFSGLIVDHVELDESSVPMTLEEGAFRGLTVDRLSWQSGSLTAINGGAFDGATFSGELRDALLQLNPLTTIDVGAFRGVEGLRYLSFYGSALSALPPGAFGGLAGLISLNLAYNSIATLQAGVFYGLTNLETLNLDGNAIADLPAGVFSGLNLRILNLRSNALAALPAGVFDDLYSLVYLDLSFNTLSVLPHDVFDGLGDIVRELDLSHNYLVGMGREDRVFASLPYETIVDTTQQTRARNSGTLPTILVRAAVPFASLRTFEDGVVGGSIGVVNLSGREATVRIAPVLPRRIRESYPSDYDIFETNELKIGPSQAFGAISRTRPLQAAEFFPLDNFEFAQARWDWDRFEFYLDIETDSNIRVLPYTEGFRTSTGGETASYSVPMHDVLAPNALGELQVPMFYAASNTTVMSRLHLVNSSASPAAVSIRAIDDRGRNAGPVTLQLTAGEARSLSAADLEGGAGDLEGRLGAGAGPWRLLVTAGESVVGMNLLETAAGFVTNLSTTAKEATVVPLLESAAVEMRQGFVRIINESNEPGTVRVSAYDDGGIGADPFELALGANQAIHFTADELQNGNAAMGLEGVGPPTQGDWHLNIDTTLDVQVLSYIRANDGVMTPMHDVLQRDSQGRLEAPRFPAFRNTVGGEEVLYAERELEPLARAPKLRLINFGTEAVEVSIGAVNESVGTGRTLERMTLEIGALQAHTLAGKDLFLNGDFDDLCDFERSCWLRLVVTAPPSVLGMALYEGDHLVNYSTAATDILVREADSSPATIDICDRTPLVRAAILNQARTDDCAAVASNRIAYLEINGELLTTLQQGDFNGLSNLKRLVLVNNPLAILPEGVFDGLTGLRALYLVNNGLGELPTGLFDSLSELQELRLAGNRLATLPEGIFDGLSELRELHLEGSGLATLRQGVFDGLSRLRALHLNGNSLATLPPGVFDGLSGLQELNLRGNRLAALPATAFGGLSALRALNLRGNRLATLPAGVFDGLFGLRTLHLSANGLVTLPEGVFDSLPDLLELHLHKNRLTGLPDGAFDSLPRLRELNLRENSLTALPDGAFDGLPSLRELDLNKNRLTTLPEEGVFDGVTNLDTLRLGDNSFETLPEGLFDSLFSLKTLVLSRNRLTTLPDGLFDGTYNLRSLDLRWNRLTTLPDSSPALRWADLRNNHLGGSNRSVPVLAGYADLDSVHLEEQADVGYRHLSVPLLVSANSERQGFVRVINQSERAHRIRIIAYDDSGWAAEPIELDLNANHALHLNASDLENGNANKGIRAGIGPPAQGHWRLSVEAPYGVRVLTYVRSNDGFLATTHERLPTYSQGLHGRHGLAAWIFASPRTWSKLRLTNTGVNAESVSVRGNSFGPSTLTLPAGESRTLSALRLPVRHGAPLFITAGAYVEGMNLLDSASGHLANLSSQPSGYTLSDTTVPLLTSTPGATRQGVVRIVNDGHWSGRLQLLATDDGGTAEIVPLPTIGYGAVVNYDADDIVNGDGYRLTGIGPPTQGDWWRLDAGTFGDHTRAILAYVRTEDGFLTTMHDRLPLDAQGRLVAWTFNSASNTKSVSKLRLTNTGVNAESVSVEGVDDQGNSSGPLTLTLPAGESRTLSAFDLENGAPGLTGSLGDGAGKWRLFITAGAYVEGMNLLDSASGHLANLSTEGTGGQ